MFDVPFQYGGGWDQAADDAAQMVVVLSKKTNEKAFGGENSVGRTLRLDGHDYRVVGVLDDWAPTPKFYDLNNGPFDEPEEPVRAVRLGTQLRAAERRQHQLLEQPADRHLPGLPEHRLRLAADLGGAATTANKARLTRSFIDNYVREQKALGRFERPLNNHLRRRTSG